MIRIERVYPRGAMTPALRFARSLTSAKGAHMRSIGVACAVLWLVDVNGAAAASQACRPVSHVQLEALLPVLPGFARNRPVGETDNVEAVSRTTVDYEAGAAVVSIELMDSCRRPEMLMQLREVLTTGAPATRGTSQRSLPIRGFPAYEEWTAESQHGEVHVLVADRFMVKVTGALVAGRAVVEGAATAIDLQKLATLK